MYYFSRTQLRKYAGKLAGELYIEKYLKTCGVKIVYPEQLSLHEQLKILKNAKLIIMTEGSAYHTFQLLGRTNCNLFIIKRRPNVDVNIALTQRCNVKTNHTSHIFFKKGLDAAGNLDANHGLCIYPIDLVREITMLISEHNFTIKKQQVSEKEYNEIVQDDIANFKTKQLRITKRVHNIR